MVDVMNVVHFRPDALVIAYRGMLHEHPAAPKKCHICEGVHGAKCPGDIRREIFERARVAVQHGKAAIRVADLEWEIGFSRIPRRWALTRKDHVRILVDLQAPGAVWSPVKDVVHTKREDLGPMLDPYGRNMPTERVQVVGIETEYEKEPGWTLELVFYAQWLADRSLTAAVDEARKIASGFAKCFEERVRRLDLCADIAGATVDQGLVKRMVTRSRAAVNPRKPESPQLYFADDAVTHHRHGALNGITVGTKNWIGRMYDKVQELREKPGSTIVRSEENDAECMQVLKREREEERWTKGGWNGLDPIARVEFELHGQALRELGVFKADEIQEPSARRISEMVEGGQVCKHCARTKDDHEDGLCTFAARTRRKDGVLYTLEEYLPKLWASSLDWWRIVKLERTRTGQLKQKTRCPLDERWEALHTVNWGEPFPGSNVPIKRFRKRSHVAAAQAVGSMASLVAAAGQLPLFPEDADDYKENASEKLRTMLTLLCKWGVDQIMAGLIDRWGSSEAAAEHLAIRLNAARARFALARRTIEAKETGPPWQTDSIKQRSSETSEPIRS